MRLKISDRTDLVKASQLLVLSSCDLLLAIARFRSPMEVNHQALALVELASAIVRADLVKLQTGEEDNSPTTPQKPPDELS